MPLHIVLAAARQLEERRLVRREGVDLVLTDEGREAAGHLSGAREESLAELLGDWWTPDRPTNLTQLVEELNEEMCGSDAERPHEGTLLGFYPRERWAERQPVSSLRNQCSA